MAAIGHYLPEGFAEVPGLRTEETSQVFPIVTPLQFQPIWDAVSTWPDFFAIPIHWWRSQFFTPTDKARVFEVWVSKEKRFMEAPHIFNFHIFLIDVVKGGGSVSSLFNRPHFGLHPVSANKWRLLAGKQELTRIRACLKELKRDKGLRFRDD